eukprot:4604410-Ditylum_brightwellii.AAC.1
MLFEVEKFLELPICSPRCAHSFEGGSVEICDLGSCRRVSLRDKVKAYFRLELNQTPYVYAGYISSMYIRTINHADDNREEKRKKYRLIS